VGNSIRNARHQRGLSQADVGARLDPAVTQQQVGKWERGVNEPNIGHLRQLAQLLGLRLDDLVGGEPSFEGDLNLAASGADLEELRLTDPEAYAQVVELARFHLERARNRGRA